MLGRRDSEDERHSSSSSSSASVSPFDSSPGPTRPAALRSQRPSKSERFKALLLRKGGRSDSSSRMSAVERLRIGGAPEAAPDLHSDLSHDQPPSDAPDVNAHLTLTSQCVQKLMFAWRPKEPTRLPPASSCSSPFAFLSAPSAPSAQPRSLTPPCSASRRFAARCRLYAAPMTAIFEVESEEEEEADDEVFC